MPHYAPYTTTVVGAHSVPRWYEALDRLVALGQLAEGDFADAQLRATQAAILEQEVAGIDVITGGEMHRRRHNRHSPPNAMLNHFWHKIPSFQGETRPKPITGIRQCLPSGGDLQRADTGQCRSGARRRIQNRLVLCTQTCEDHHDRAASSGGGRS